MAAPLTEETEPDGGPVDIDEDEIEDVEMVPEEDDGQPARPEPLGLMVAFLPSDIDLDQISVPGGLPEDDLHLTLRYYGTASNEVFVEQVHEAARTIAGNIRPFVASVSGRRQLGSEDPPADVLILADHKAFRLALAKLPPSDKDYPAFTPHITVGYGIGDDALAKSNPDNEVLFDHIVVANGNDDWTVYMLGDIPPDALNDVNPDDLIDTTGDDVEDVPMVNEDGTMPAPVTAGLDDVIEGKINAPGSRTKSKTVGKLDPRPGGKHQKCFHGSPATCKSVRWIAVYTALREKRGFSKSKAAAIANAMHNKWRRGQPNRPGQRPMIRKTI